jgi:hypothetical protein
VATFADGGIETATISGVKCVSAIAKDEKAALFYEKYGFKRLRDVNQLFLPIETLINAKK